MFEEFIRFAKNLYHDKSTIPLHEPCFRGNEKKYLTDTIESTFVSTIGKYVEQFEALVSSYTGSQYAVATVNGTSALHAALLVAGVKRDDEVITQPLTFVATCNAITYCGASPVFIDIDKDTLGLSPDKLQIWLDENTVQDNSVCRNKISGNTIRACVPMHTFGHPSRIDRIVEICSAHNIAVIEDAAESIGSLYKNQHTGTFGSMGVFSFNGNKIITTGGGGMIITNDKDMAKSLKHLTTTAKAEHRWLYFHDEIGYNYRLPNLNAALGCAQMEILPVILKSKRKIAELYQDFFASQPARFLAEPPHCHSNYWLNCIILDDIEQRDEFLTITNHHGVITRPAWQLMHTLPMYKNCVTGDLKNATRLTDRIVNIPSSTTTF